MKEEEKMARSVSPRERMLEDALRKNFDGNQTRLARAIDTSQQNIYNFFTGVALRPFYLDKVLKALEIDERDYEQAVEFSQASGFYATAAKVGTPPRRGRRLPSDVTVAEPRKMPLRTSPVRMLPVLGEAVGGVDGKYVFNGSILDYVACPPSLENVPNAYAVYVDGESMSPRYRPGETVWVHPSKPARRGDDVIVQIHPQDDDGSPPYGYIKEFIGWQGTKLVLQQHNPNQKVEFFKDEVVSVHPIILSGKY